MTKGEYRVGINPSRAKMFDEYGHYGENNPPLPPMVSKEIRDMTEEEKQRSKEREQKNRPE